MNPNAGTTDPKVGVSFRRSGDHWYVVLRDGEHVHLLPLHVGEPGSFTCIDCGCELVEGEDGGAAAQATD